MIRGVLDSNVSSLRCSLLDFQQRYSHCPQWPADVSAPAGEAIGSQCRVPRGYLLSFFSTRRPKNPYNLGFDVAPGYCFARGRAGSIRQE
jgi:hypothetical protein